MPKIPPQNRKSIKTGLITESAVSDNDFPQDACVESINFDFDTIGSCKLRSGLTQVGNTLSGESLGYYEFRDSGSGSNNQIMCINGTDLYYLSTGTWTAKRSSLTASAKARFSTLLDYVFMVNGSNATAVWDGNPSNSFVTTGNALNAPVGRFIENFRARMWIAGNSTYPDRLYYSSLPSAVTTPIVTWDTNVLGGYWIDVSPSDGENITGLHRTKNYLLVFKNNHIYQVASINSLDADPKIDVGTYSQESIVEAKNGVYFHHPTGFYRYLDGGVQEISQPIIDIVGAITLANYSKVAGVLDKSGNHILWSIGDVTYGGTTYSNMVVRYTISTGTWTHRCYPTQWTTSGTYNDGTTLYKIIGDESGHYYKLDTGLLDGITDISYSLIHAWDAIDGLRSSVKTINKMYFEHKGGAGTNVSMQVANDITNDWTKTIGQFKMLDTGFNNVTSNKGKIKGRKVRVRISGSSKGQPFTYEGYEVVDSSNELVTF